MYELLERFWLPNFVYFLRVWEMRHVSMVFVKQLTFLGYFKSRHISGFFFSAVQISRHGIVGWASCLLISGSLLQISANQNSDAQFWLCGSRKYSYPSHRTMFWFAPPTPSEIPNYLASYFSLKTFASATARPHILERNFVWKTLRKLKQWVVAQLRIYFSVD